MVKRGTSRGTEFHSQQTKQAVHNHLNNFNSRVINPMSLAFGGIPTHRHITHTQLKIILKILNTLVIAILACQIDYIWNELKSRRQGILRGIFVVVVI